MTMFHQDKLFKVAPSFKLYNYIMVMIYGRIYRQKKRSRESIADKNYFVPIHFQMYIEYTKTDNN